MQRATPQDETQEMLARLKAAAIATASPHKPRKHEVMVSRADLVALIDLAFALASQIKDATIAAADSRALCLSLTSAHAELPTAGWLIRGADGEPCSILLATADTTPGDIADVLIAAGDGATAHELIER